MSQTLWEREIHREMYEEAVWYELVAYYNRQPILRDSYKMFFIHIYNGFCKQHSVYDYDAIESIKNYRFFELVNKYG